jgi:hypothetical protein
MEALLQAERDAASILLNDWTHSTSDTIYAQYFETGAFPNCVDSILANGQGRVQCLPEYMLQAGPGLGLSPPSSMTMSGMDRRTVAADSSSMDPDMMMAPTLTTSHTNKIMVTSSSVPKSGMLSMSSMPSMPEMSSPMTSLTPRGCTPPMMFKPGFNSSSLPPDTCTNTTSSLLTIHGNSTQGWLALNLVNAGSVSKLGVSLDAHTMFVYAADGLYVKLQEVKVCITQPLNSKYFGNFG